MPDPQVLYIVSAVVIAALAAWSFYVQRSAPNEDALPKGTRPLDPEIARANAVANPVAAPVSKGEKMASAAAAIAARASHAEVELAPYENEALDFDEEEPTGPDAMILVNAVGRTDKGLARKNNEDAYLIRENYFLFAIADGMGRHAAGEVASKRAVEAMEEIFEKETALDAPPAPKEDGLSRRAARLRRAIVHANAAILEQAAQKPQYSGMGTTIVAAYFSPNKQRVYIAHVGDSRCYRVRRGELKQLTRDHTLGEAGIVGKTAQVLSRAVGVDESVEVDVIAESPMPGDIYLLCSDGLTRMVKNEQILETLSKSASMDEASARLIEIANENGGRDNITAICVRVDAAPRVSRIPAPRS